MLTDTLEKQTVKMEQISERLARLSESQTLAMTQKSRELKAKGIDVINLSIGEPDFNTPDHIKEAAKKAIDDNFSHYSPVPGYDELRQAIAKKLERENNLIYKPEQIIVSNGAKHSIINVILGTVNHEDEVIIPAPYWVSYLEFIRLARGKAVVIPSGIENNFKITPEQVESVITPQTRVFMFSSPCNPSGTVYTKEELKALAAVFARNKHVLIISDEIYEHINFVGHHESIAQFPEIKDQVIVVNGVSKGYAMTGWRIGFIAAPLWLAKAVNKLQGQLTSGPCSVAQMAAVAAFNGGNETIIQMREVFRRRRDLMLGLLKDIPGIKTNVPDGAFYIFADFSYYVGKSDGDFRITSTDDLCLYLLNSAFVALVGGSAFGTPEYLRFSYATSDENLIKSAERIKIALAKLK